MLLHNMSRFGGELPKNIISCHPRVVNTAQVKYVTQSITDNCSYTQSTFVIASIRCSWGKEKEILLIKRYNIQSVMLRAVGVLVLHFFTATGSTVAGSYSKNNDYELAPVTESHDEQEKDIEKEKPIGWFNGSLSFVTFVFLY